MEKIFGRNGNASLEKRISTKNQTLRSIKKNITLYLFLLVPIAYFIIFKYIPMAGNIIAFRKFVTGKSIFGVEWKGLYYFKLFFKDPKFWSVFKNTIIISFLTLLISFPLPIVFALLLNEITGKKFKKIVQTVTIVPKFLSVVVVVMIINGLLSPSTGIVNILIERFGGESIYFLGEPSWFRTIYVSSDIWQFLGWNSIIYMAVLSSADQSQYEAAMVDGANRWKQTIYITLPLMLPTISINLIIAIGTILNVGFEKILLLYSPAVYSTADVIQTYVYRIGLVGNNYSYGTAIGLFQGLLGLILLWLSNKLTNKLWDCGLW